MDITLDLIPCVQSLNIDLKSDQNLPCSVELAGMIMKVNFKRSLENRIAHTVSNIAFTIQGKWFSLAMCLKSC